MKSLLTLALSLILIGVSHGSYDHPLTRVGEIGDKTCFCIPFTKRILKSPDWTPDKPLPTPIKKLRKKVRAYVHKFLSEQGEDPDRWIYAGTDILSLKGSVDSKWFIYMRYQRALRRDHVWVAVTLDGKIFPLVTGHKVKK